MSLWRLYLLAGLVIHKAVWEALKRRSVRSVSPPAQPFSASLFFVKAVKIAILGGLVAQSVLPEVLPLVAGPGPLRAVGLAVFTLGLLVAVIGRVQLGDNWSDIEAARVLQNQRVVATGIYRYIRHPIYTGDLLLLLGFELSLNSWLVLGVAVLAPVVVTRALREERLLAQALPDYAVYCAGTKRFVPFVV